MDNNRNLDAHIKWMYKYYICIYKEVVVVEWYLKLIHIHILMSISPKYSVS